MKKLKSFNQSILSYISSYNKILFIVAYILSSSSILYAESDGNQKYLLYNKSYRTKANMKVCESKNTDNCDIAIGSQSSFVVLDNDDKEDGNYTVKFTVFYPDSDETNRTKFNIQKAYYINNISSNDLPITKNVIEKTSGMVSGPLIIPFKYRLDDESFVSDATIGIYVGWGYSTKFWGMSDEALTLIPFLSTGISQISIPSQDTSKSNKTTTRTGFTWAGGLLIQNWADVNIGIVYGQDRIGDNKAWEHEGEGWLSISINWQI